MPSHSAAQAYARASTGHLSGADPQLLTDPVAAAAVAATAAAEPAPRPTPAADPAPPRPAARPDPAGDAPAPGLRRGAQEGTWLVTADSAEEALERARQVLGDVAVLGGRRTPRGLLGRSARVTVTVRPVAAAEQEPVPADPVADPARAAAAPEDFRASLSAALGAVARVVEAPPAPAPPARARLAALGVPAAVLEALPAAGPGTLVEALTAAIAAVVPAPAALAPGLAVASGSGPAGAAAILRAATVGVLPGQLVLDGLVAPASAANLARALCAEPGA